MSAPANPEVAGKSKPHLVLVVGGSRGIGRTTVDAALERGLAVRALSRGLPDGLAAMPGSDLEWFAGDATSPDDMAGALDGVDAVVLTLGIDLNPATVFAPVRLFSTATRIVVDAMAASGPRRLIVVTGFGAGDSRECLGCLQRLGFEAVLGRAYDDKDVQEQIVRSSRLDWTIVRPGILTNGPATGRYRVLVDRPSWRNGFVSRVDVADFLADLVVTGRHVREAPAVIG